MKFCAPYAKALYVIASSRFSWLRLALTVEFD